jgi:subtilisin family serine protease
VKTRLLSFFIVVLLGVAEAFAGAQVIVKLEPQIDAKNISRFMGGRVLDEIPRQHLYLIEVPAKLAASARFLGVHSWEPNRLVQKKLNSVKGVIISAPNLAPQWYYTQPALTRIGRPGAELLSTGRGVVIADINSSVDYAHPALIGALTSGYDFILGRPYAISAIALNQSDVAFLDQSDVAFLDQSDVAFLDGALALAGADAATTTYLTSSGVTPVSASTLGLQVTQSAYSHGTLCAGMIHSIAPDSMIMPLRAFDDNGNSDLFTLAKAIDFAVANSAQVINLSFGLGSDSSTVHTSIQAALNAGITVVASAGNDNTTVDQYPAAYSGVLSVAAVDNSDLKASFSDYSPSVAVSAPGVNVVSSFPGGYYALISGTSFSAPIVAGEAALVRAVLKNPATAIPQTSVNINALNVNYAGGLGAGRINLSQAVGGQ